MSDYPNPNIHRGDGVSARGVLVAFAIVAAIILLLAIVGAMGSGGSEGAPTQDAIAPAAQSTTVPTE
ncbi:hypothetical protein [Tateyamaria sp. SN6-1]|uniref:hypothetical protein n=1 Tax=Tateyamaria sp. SN6-1 TaxID=3092148 RepID=UPI0039F54D2A